MNDAFIYDHVRTPRGRGRPDGALHEISSLQLATQTLVAIRERNELDTARLDDVIFGIVSPVGEQGAVLPRSAVLNADYDESVPGTQVNRFCGSGLEAVNLGTALVLSGQSSAILAGGVESMSRVPIGSDGGAWATDPSFAPNVNFVPQGISADLIATRDGWSREDVDAYAVESHRRAAVAWNEGRFARSVLPVRDLLGDVVLERDEHLRPDTKLEDLSALKPAFEQMGHSGGFDAVVQGRYPEIEHVHHVHTAGNSSGIVDGASCVLIGDEAYGRDIGLKPRARIIALGSIGSEPCIMLTGPADIARRLLDRAGLKVEDIDLFEVNEAFASVVLHFMRELDIPHSRVNVNGGAIALGHPLGATGGMLLGTVLDELERQQLSRALITLCVGAGMATGAIIERV